MSTRTTGRKRIGSRAGRFVAVLTAAVLLSALFVSGAGAATNLQGNVGGSPDDLMFARGTGPDHPAGCNPDGASTVPFTTRIPIIAGPLTGSTVTLSGSFTLGPQDRTGTFWGFDARYGDITGISGTFSINASPPVSGTFDRLGPPFTTTGRNVGSCYGVGPGPAFGRDVEHANFTAIDANVEYTAGVAGETVTGQTLFRQRQICHRAAGSTSSGCSGTGPSLSFHSASTPVLPQISIPDASYDEAEEAANPDGFAEIMMTLDRPALAGTYVRVTLVDESATHGEDYELIGGTSHVRYAPTNTTRFPVTLRVFDDPEREGPETFRLELSDPQNAGIADGVAVVTIDDTEDAPLPEIVPGHALATEGDSGSTTLAVPVTLSAASPEAVTVDWATIDTLDQPRAGVDYAPGSGALTFAPGETSKTVPVTIYGDVVDEPGAAVNAEWGGIRYSSPVNATFGTGAFANGSFVLIVDDDPAPTITPGIGGVLEGNTGTRTLQVPVTLSAPSANEVTVQWATLDSAGQPSAGVDFAPSSGTLTFAPGETTKTVPVTVYGDTVDEPGQLWNAEWAGVRFSAPVNGKLGSGFASIGFALIVDDD